MKIPTEDFTGVTLAIGDPYGNYVRGGDDGDGKGGPFVYTKLPGGFFDNYDDDFPSK